MVKPAILRTKSVTTKVTEAEYARLEEQAALAGLNLSEWIRGRLLENADGKAGVLLGEMLLTRAKDEHVRMRLLFDVVTCSTWLNRSEILNKAIRELRRFPDYDVSHAFVVMTQVSALVDFGRAQEALELINANIKSPILKKEEFQDWKYEYLFLKGRSLTRLARCDEALQAFDEAHGLQASGKFEADILLDRANCLLYLGRYDESFEVARACYAFHASALHMRAIMMQAKAM